MDSTVLDDAVATQDTVTQLAARSGGSEGDPGGGRCGSEAHDYSQPGKPACDWTDPAARDALVSALVADTRAILEVVAEVELKRV